MVENKKKGTGLKVLVVILILLLIGAFGFMYYGYTKYMELKDDNTNLNSKYEDLQKDFEKSKQDEKNTSENLITKTSFDLDSCNVSGYSCSNEITAGFNNSNHKVKIERYQEKDSTNHLVFYNYKLYVDNEQVDVFKSELGVVSDNYREGKSEEDFDIHVYVFNNKDLGVIYKDLGETSKKYKLVMYKEGKTKKGDALPVYIGDLSFDGETLKYWYLDCATKKYSNIKHVKIAVTFDGESIITNDIDTRDHQIGGGAGYSKKTACYDKEKNIFSTFNHEFH